MRRLAIAVTLVSLLGLPVLAFAHDGPHEPGTEHTEAAPPEADPVPDAASQMAAAKQRLDRAEAAYIRMMHRDYPRGDARAEIVKERQEARAEWERLAAEHPDLVPAN
jgi:hypothetical protein